MSARNRRKRNAKRKPTIALRAARASFRPAFESLEERCVLSMTVEPALTVTRPPWERDVWQDSLLAVTSPWHNRGNYADVVGDGGVDPLDLLNLFNDMLRNGIHEIRLDLPVSPPFLDVNADNVVSPLDALQVINQLTEQSAAQASARPNTRLTLAGAFDPNLPTTVRFTDQDGSVLETIATKVTSTEVQTVVPTYFDTDTLQFRNEVVSVTVVQDTPGGSQTIYDHFLIGDFPPRSNVPGEFTRELLRGVQGLTALNLGDYRRIAAAFEIEDSAGFVAFEDLLEEELRQLQVLENLVDQLTSSVESGRDWYAPLFQSSRGGLILAQSRLYDVDRQISAWIEDSYDNAGMVSPDDVTSYLGQFEYYAQRARTVTQDVNLENARRAYENIVNFAHGTVFTAASLEHDVSALRMENVTGGAAAETFLAALTAGMATMADLQLVAQEFQGTNVQDFRDTISYLVDSGLNQILQIGGGKLANLQSSRDAGTQLLRYVSHLGDAQGALHNPGIAGNLGELGAVFDASFSDTTPLASAPGVNSIVLVPVLVTADRSTTSFFVQLTQLPESDVTIHFTSTDPTVAQPTPSIVVHQFEWLLLAEITITSFDDDEADGTRNYSIEMTTESDDPAFDGLAFDGVSVLHYYWP